MDFGRYLLADSLSLPRPTVGYVYTAIGFIVDFHCDCHSLDTGEYDECNYSSRHLALSGAYHFAIFCVCGVLCRLCGQRDVSVAGTRAEVKDFRRNFPSPALV